MSNDIEDIQANPFINNARMAKLILKDMLKMDPSKYSNVDGLNQCFRLFAKKYKYQTSKRELGLVYRQLIKLDPVGFPYNDILWTALINKSVRSESGIINVSVSLPPNEFSCKYNCHFCPNEPGMPRSYLSNEDVFKRAAEVGFDTVKQVYSRLDVLEKNGYNKELADTFIRDLYYAANTYFELDSEPRERLSIEEEQAINVTAKAHVVGLGVETRPDEIDEAEIIRFRRYGVTRVEIGVQHTDDALLKKVGRGHGVKHSRQAVKLLKDYGFKVEIHIMADLPGATPEGDMTCYKEVLQGEDLIPDYMKDYPCLDVDFTKIKEWKAEGKWKPYAEVADAAELKRVLVYRQSITPPWVRVNRVQRDFREAKDGQLGFTSDSIKTNLAQIVKAEAEKQGIYCQCIRCCEVGTEKYNKHDIQYRVCPFVASGAQEYFINAFIPQEKRPLLLGFLRLRLGTELEKSVIPELKGKTAMIREIHIYGRMKQVGIGASNDTQHIGIGKTLLQIAEEISVRAGYDKMAIISGIGVRDYYRKRGYELVGTYMMKTLNKPKMEILLYISILLLLFSLFYF
jgi:ELP3 family radical SAM enzyme/protein acetyltransferase